MMQPPASLNKHVPSASAELARGRRLRAIILTALERRRVLQFKGVSAKPEYVLAGPRMRLEVWLERNPAPSDDTVRRFAHVGDVAVMLPANDEGVQRLDELRQLMAP